MKRVMIDRAELMGRIVGIESGCLDSKDRMLINEIKKVILSLPTMEVHDGKA